MNNNTMKQEVEIRALLRQDQLDKLVEKLEEIGAVLRDTEIVKDSYFCPLNVKTFEEVEMNEVGSFSLRLRNKKANDQTVVEMNIKVITQHGDHQSWEEHEITVDSFEEAEIILKSIGNKIFFTIEKQRFNYQIGEILVIVEDIKDYRPAIEMEIMTTQEESEVAKEKIKKLMARLGVQENQIVPKSITNIIMREKSVF